MLKIWLLKSPLKQNIPQRKVDINKYSNITFSVYQIESFLDLYQEIPYHSTWKITFAKFNKI